MSLHPQCQRFQTPLNEVGIKWGLQWMDSACTQYNIMLEEKREEGKEEGKGRSKGMRKGGRMQAEG